MKISADVYEDRDKNFTFVVSFEKITTHGNVVWIDKYVLDTLYNILKAIHPSIVEKIRESVGPGASRYWEENWHEKYTAALSVLFPQFKRTDISNVLSMLDLGALTF